MEQVRGVGWGGEREIGKEQVRGVGRERNQHGTGERGGEE